MRERGARVSCWLSARRESLLLAVSAAKMKQREQGMEEKESEGKVASIGEEKRREDLRGY